MVDSAPTSLESFRGKCHCGKVAYTFEHAPLEECKATRCTCSICANRGYIFMYSRPLPRRIHVLCSQLTSSHLKLPQRNQVDPGFPGWINEIYIWNTHDNPFLLSSMRKWRLWDNRRWQLWSQLEVCRRSGYQSFELLGCWWGERLVEFQTVHPSEKQIISS